MANSIVKTIEITNFTGRLTRVQNGDINSGFAKFKTSWGYDPFSKPGNLTWNHMPSVIGSITGTVLAVSRITAYPYIYCIDNTGKFYVIEDTKVTSVVSGSTYYGTDPINDQVVSVIGSFSSIAGTFTQGSSLQPTGTATLFASSDSTILKISMATGTSVDLVNSAIGTSSSIVSGVPHPLIEFQGYIYYGNSNNIGQMDAGAQQGIVLTGTKLNPPLPVGYRVTDLDLTPEGDYMLITASKITGELPGFGDPSISFEAGKQLNFATQSNVFYWNGADDTVTAIKTLPSFPAPALTSFLDKQYTVTQDTFGMALMEGNQKLLTLPDNINPPSNALSPNGTFLTWVSVEGIGEVSAASSVYSSIVSALYYYGKLDESSPTGLWRMNRIFPEGSQQMISSPLNTVVNNYSNMSNLVQGFGKHYISTSSTDAYTFLNKTNKLYRFLLNPANNLAPTSGVYETQTQIFSKRIGVTQIRVYCEPTVTGNAFQLELIGAGNDPIEGGTYTYTYGDITDPQDGSTSVERINFPGNIKTQFSLGVRITNTGTVNMTIRKIEIDYTEEGK